MYHTFLNPIDFQITGGQVHDIQMASELIERTLKSNSKKKNIYDR